MPAPTILVTDPITPFESLLNSIGASLNAERAIRTYKPADLDALLALTSGVSAGDLATVIEGGAIFRHNGTIWVQITEATFTTIALRDSAYTKASGGYKTLGGVRVYVSTAPASHMEWNGSGWALTAGFADVRMTAAQNSIASVFTPVVWDTEASNAFGWHSTSTNPSRITVPYAGRYRVTAQIEGSQAASGQYVAIGLRVNGTAQVFTQKVTAATSGNFASGTVTADLVLTANSYIEVDGFQAAAYAMHVAQSYFQVSYVGAF